MTANEEEGELRTFLREMLAGLRMSNDEHKRQFGEQVAMLLLTFESFSERSLQDDFLEDLRELVEKYRYILHGLPEEDREAIEEAWEDMGLEGVPPPEPDEEGRI